MLTSVKYGHEPGNVVWPIPFPYSSEAKVGVRLSKPTGLEVELTHGVDYVIQNGNVIYVLPREHSLIIFLDAAYNEELALNSRNVLSSIDPAQAFGGQVISASQQPGLMQANTASLLNTASATNLINTASQPAALLEQPAQTGGAASDSGLESEIAELKSQLAALSSERDQALLAARQAEADNQIQSLQSTGASCLDKVEEAQTQALSSIEQKTAALQDSLVQTGQALITASEELDSAQAKASETAAAINQAAEAALTRLANKVDELESRLAKLTQDSQAAIASANQAISENLEAKVISLESQLNTTAASAKATLDLASEQATQQAAVCQAEIKAEACACQQLASQVWPLQGYLRQVSDLDVNNILTLPEPLRYYPGRNCLFVARNGFVLTQGRDFDEVGIGASVSNVIRLLAPSRKGDIWSFWVAPTNAGQEAGIYARDAARAASDAYAAKVETESLAKSIKDTGNQTLAQGQKTLADIGQASQVNLSAIKSAGDSALDSVRALQKNATGEACQIWSQTTSAIRKESEASQKSATDLWQKARQDITTARAEALEQARALEVKASQAAQRSGVAASQAHDLASCAWQAAYMAAIDNAKPGIGCVRSLNELAIRPSGVYFINPYISMPLPFMGVWPVQSLADARFDGLFFIGIPYPEKIEEPDLPYPEEPGDVPEMKPQAATSDWLPCEHTHN